ncbi:MAG: hypothetical protein ACRD3W_30260 [Terriglobales bacterium]
MKAKLDAQRKSGTSASGLIRHLLEQHFNPISAAKKDGERCASRAKRSGLAGQERFDWQAGVVCAAVSRRERTAVRIVQGEERGQEILRKGEARAKAWAILS